MAEWKSRWRVFLGAVLRPLRAARGSRPLVSAAPAPAAAGAAYAPAPPLAGVGLLRDGGANASAVSTAGETPSPATWAAPSDRVRQLEGERQALQAELARLEAQLARERTQRQRLEREIEELADYDPLTGLARSRRFGDRLAVAIAQAQRSKQKVAVAQLGVDRLAAVEQTRGVRQRDDLLRSVALALEGTLRQVDTLARLGPEDVFALLLPGIKHDSDVGVIAEKIRLALRGPFEIGGQELQVTASVGVALFPEDGPDAETLLQRAGVAMLQARARGGDGWEVHAPGSRALATKRQARESALRQALARERLELVWQPVVACQTGAIVGMHAQLALAGETPGAGETVTLSEEGALAVPLGQWALRAACQQAARWRAAGHAPLVVSLDVSLRQLVHGAFVRLVRGVLDAGELPPEALELEVPEAELTRGPEVAVERLAELRRLGVRIALDHFGTDESRLAHVHRYPLDTLKIDASVVRAAVGSREQQAVVQAAVGLARSRRLRVVAEGVDHEAQRALLVESQCDWMHGVLCGPAASAEVAGARLASGLSGGPANGGL